MAHRIGRKESVEKALLRLVDDDLSGARAKLASNGNREQRIHRARRRLKRAGTVLKVLQQEFGDTAVDARRSVSASARLLGKARDADVVAASAREIAEARDDIGLHRMVESLDKEAAEAHRAETPVGKVRKQLADVADEIAALPPDFDGALLFDEALDRAYRRGRKAMRRAQASMETSALHRWRKEVKHLFHLTRLARKRLPGRSRRLASRLDRLGEVLGVDHDHAILAEKLEASPSDNRSLMRQLSVISERRRALEAEAFSLGAAVYRQKPMKFARRMSVS